LRKILAIFMNNSERKLSISIVNFNSGEYLEKCLSSLSKTGGSINLEIWVVDNNSSDNSLELAKEKFPDVNYIDNNQNLGFGRAHNIALRKIKSEFVLILNPDTEVESGVISSMLNFIEGSPGVGAATCKVLLGNGKLDLASHRGFPTPFASFLYYFLKNGSLYHLSNAPMDKIHEVDAISGSFFLTRKSVLEKVGYFDEDYFMYAEDIDLCFRIKEVGFKVMFVPEVSIIHHKGVSSGLKKHSQNLSTADIETKMRSLNAFYGAMKIFYKKRMEQKYPFFINRLVYLGINLKWFLAKQKMQV